MKETLQLQNEQNIPPFCHLITFVGDRTFSYVSSLWSFFRWESFKNKPRQLNHHIPSLIK